MKDAATRLFLWLSFSVIIFAIGGNIVLSVIESDRAKERARIIRQHEEDEKTKRTNIRSQTVRDIIPWSKVNK